MFTVLRPVFALVCVVFLATYANAESSFESFTKERFDALQAEGAPVLIDVHAVWCPTCKRQGKALQKFQSEHASCDLTILSVDFDDQKEWVTYFKAPRQSTFVLFSGGEKVWFSVAETRYSVISDALTSNIKEC